MIVSKTRPEDRTTWQWGMFLTAWMAGLASVAMPSIASAAPIWAGYAGNAQHDALSTVASQPLQAILWSATVDMAPVFTEGSEKELLIHYGSPMIMQDNTVLLPQKTGGTDGFQITAMNGATGNTLWTAPTDYILPGHNWVPSYSPALTPSQRLYYAGAGGTVYSRDATDSSPSAPVTQTAFYGLANYTANKSAYDQSVFINTPITSDGAGNIYFGYQVTGSNPQNIQGGIARIGADGSTSYMSAATIAADATITKTVQNSAPALSRDGNTLYVAVNGANGGYLATLNAATLAPQSRAFLRDPNGNAALVLDDGTASPTIGPDGEVYFGVLENPFPSNHDRGWLLHFSADLATSKTPGAFGWDDTASVVPASMVPSYHGTSRYLLMTKYNNYAGEGGDGVNKLAILDPGATKIDPITGQTIMNEILTIAGPTHDPSFPSNPNAVREWCINSAVVDPATDSVLANSEDGKLYRWDLSTNTFSEVMDMTAGIGEAYTPTLIGADGTVYAINDGNLFAIGAVPEPTAILVPLAAALLLRRKARRGAVSLVAAAV